uniref:Uncharacterized protein n=1 Tax=Verrucosispora sp. MS100047 TaxID=1410949 RepID=A0A097CRK8_9ACTN|nr:hypothetical protein VASRM7_46 [Verrucosispora sp. MS100047]
MATLGEHVHGLTGQVLHAQVAAYPWTDRHGISPVSSSFEAR